MEWIEVLRLVGADKIIHYVLHVHPNVMKVRGIINYLEPFLTCFVEQHYFEISWFPSFSLDNKSIKYNEIFCFMKDFHCFDYFVPAQSVHNGKYVITSLIILCLPGLWLLQISGSAGGGDDQLTRGPAQWPGPDQHVHVQAQPGNDSISCYKCNNNTISSLTTSTGGMNQSQSMTASSGIVGTRQIEYMSIVY